MSTSNYTTANVANIMSEFLPLLHPWSDMLVPTGFGQPKLMAQLMALHTVLDI